VTTVDVAADGLLVRSSTSLMGLDMVMTLSNRDAVIELRGTTELLAQSFIYPDRAIDRPREVVRAVYELTVDEGFLPNVPSIGDQRAKNSRGRARVTVELGSSPKVDPRTVDVAEYLRASTYLNHRDPKLGELRAQALDPVETTDPAVRAEALRELVHAHLVKKDLNTLLATASEVATTRAGDCTEHAVLLAALLRADGIPSRVVTGLVYVDRFVGEVNLFGYHMWTQAFLDGRWIDLDATLGRRFDATHIAFTHTSLNDEGVALLQMAKITPLMGRLEVKVLEVDHAPEAEVAGESR
jgi:transglutaminase-like putative cysteine protease